jgi:hypothetical protein
MSVAEMKKEAIVKISAINDELVLAEIIQHLNNLKQQDAKALDIDAIWKEAVLEYGDVLEKLAQ